MRFIVDRKKMQAACRNLARLVPETSPIEDLTGILMEADENGGGIRLMATNLEITLECHREAVVAEGGRMVLNGNIMAGMMPLLAGDRVSFETLPGANVVRIACGTAHYDLSYLSGKHFPEPPVIPMESTAKLSGLAGLAKRTAFAARQKTGASADMLTNAKLEVYPTEAHMEQGFFSLWRYYPEKWAMLRKLEEMQGRPFKHGYPTAVLEKRFATEREMEKVPLNFFDAT